LVRVGECEVGRRGIEGETRTRRVT
jgi:hypothetical protein